MFFAYLLGIPALYIVLVLNKKSKYLDFHGSQALLLWCGYFICFFGLRFLINWIWLSSYLPQLEILEWLLFFGLAVHAVFCAVRGFSGKQFRIPL
ncbi:MAG: hypothetical protein KJ811_04175 [Candidatus Margulisbacteria bacterium]|nr:hypothetical protein [Candidatus Margulisiibacteriota bacterium]